MKKNLTRSISSTIAVLALALGSAVVPATSAHAATIPQAAPNPVVIAQTNAADNLVMLTAGGAERPDTMTVVSSPQPKYGYVTGFTAATDYLLWNVNVASTANYNVTIEMNSGATSQTYQLQVDTGTPKTFTIPASGWARVSAAVITIPSGTHSIKMQRVTLSGISEVKGIELLRTDLQAGYDARVAAYDAAATASSAAFAAETYGVMFQYGAWGYPVSGTTPKTLDQQAADFNVPAFVSMIQSTGASYIMWSATWWTYEIDAPIAAVDSVIGNGNRTASRDLIGDVALALSNVGIDFYLYYHTGQDSHLGYGSTDWWQAQAWPSSFSSNGVDPRTTFFTNWKAVIREMGLRYGTLLKGWFFDDGRMYYPSKFEDLASAARAGNPSRLISYNQASAAVLTDFQDVSFGETCRSSDAATGGTGRYLAGPEAGLAGHCMYKMNGQWGISAANETTTLNYTASSAYSLVQTNLARKVPTSFDIVMWEDGTVDAATLATLQGLKLLMETGCGAGCTKLNNTDPSITYTGTWALSSNRNKGDYNNDVQYTSSNGSSLSFTFTGTGVTTYMPKYSSYGNFTVTVDGVSKGTFNATATTYTPQSATYSIDGLAYGTHTVTLTKTSGTYMQLDFIQYRTGCAGCTVVNNTSTSISYAGTWALSSNRNKGDYDNDVQYTATNGNSFSFTFTGTGVTVYMPKYTSYGNFTVTVDGVSKGTFNAISTTYLPQSATYSVEGLTSGAHTITITKAATTGYLQLDYIAYRP